MGRGTVAVVGILAVAWLVLYLGSYGVLVGSEEVSAERLKREAAKASEVERRELVGAMVIVDFGGSSSVLRCTYLMGTGLSLANFAPRMQPVCPRLWSFGR
jgi:hypothetical protein